MNKNLVIDLPTEVRPVKSVNPHMMLIYSPPKVGKTTIVGGLEDALIIETEPYGANYISGKIVEVNKPSEFNAVLDAIEEKNTQLGGYMYRRIVIDTITKLDEWSEIVGTYEYMNKPQGKKFNLKDPKQPSKGKFNHLDSSFETVHEIANGFGYRYSREVMLNWYDRLSTLAEEIILIAHIKDKFIESKTGDTVETRDINLTGKVKSTYASRLDAIGYLRRDGDVGVLSFNPKENLVCGGRCKHLNGDIVISEKQENGDIKTFWENIYI